MNRIIYVIGDSHQQSFDKRWYHDADFVLRTKDVVYGPDDVIFKIIPFGSHPAYVVPDNDNSIHVALEQTDKGKEIWFMFGEIDTRYHIFHQHKTKGIRLDEAIDLTIIRYLGYISGIRGLGYNIIVVSADPAIRAELIDTESTMIRHNDATDQDRIYITEAFNSKLKLECSYHGIPFVDIYYWLVDPRDNQSRKDLLNLHYIPEKARAGILEGMHYKYLGDLVIEKLNLKGK
jgi:hypothetical protein